ncbi:Cytosolic endo-beta-N-acetylglucosaminidase [Rhynchospora pubera]|uniref:mannosyl-glycoprotein endo-beta-N-acetylglucosaminidase n=1 Tax=Rhynchospora pubera TaxID=906938 RepID=A0AAV8EXJ5_9POAL|nr:Cytosolic endo-beta-N-acetylglucosaminidase [Rhynchospora pubera]
MSPNCQIQFIIISYKMIKSMVKYPFHFFKSLIHLLSNSDASSDHRPWDPPFDPTRPAIPISYPITDLDALESRSYFNSFHFPFNIASVQLPPDSVELPARPRLLVCHDMKGGYTDDLWVQGGNNAEAYAIWHWHLMDVFVYFSHYLVTLPPPSWTNAAHTHGVKVLGTFLTEWKKGAEICKRLLATKDSAQMYAERLAELATVLGFDGWLINIENKLAIDLIDNLKEFVNHLTKIMHSSVPGSLVIWYDATTIEGKLEWQDQLNNKNKPFFDLCDGIFVNYTWKKEYPKKSIEIAGERKHDVYMGIDVFGRNTYGGGKWNTNMALDLLKKESVSAAMFAPGWVYETEQGPDFQTAQNRWWGLVEKSWGVLQSYPKQLPFYSNFDQGHGYHISVNGSQVNNNPWNNMSAQLFQPILIVLEDENTMQASIDFKDIPYNGGGSIMIEGNLKQGSSSWIQLFSGYVPLKDQSVYISYSVKSEGESALAICLEFSLATKEVVHALITDDELPFLANRSKFAYDIIVKSEGSIANASSATDVMWVLYKATISSDTINSNCPTLTGIYSVSTLKSSAGMYSTSLGHLTISFTKEGIQFPFAKDWKVEGRYVSWFPSDDGTRTLRLKIIWLLGEMKNRTYLFTKYNIYVETSGFGTSYLGFARVQAFYVSDLAVPNEVTMIKFVIQPCGNDGTCHELSQCPTYILNA